MNGRDDQRTFRAGIIGLLQESNTFIEGRTTLQHFRDDLLLHGEAIREVMGSAPHEVGGFFDGLQDEKVEAVPLFLARAVPYGIIEAASFAELLAMMQRELDSALPLDGLLLAPHGATVAEGQPDADGHWLALVRRMVGPDVPIVATIDPHANLSGQMVGATNALVAYATNPHIDQRETGRKAALLLARHLRGEIRLRQAAVMPPLAVNIQSQQTSEPPLSRLYRRAADLASDALSHSIVLGFPYADVAEMGSSVIVVTDARLDDAPTDSDSHGFTIARSIATEMVAMRYDFEPEFVNADDAVALAAESAPGPTLLLDMGDNVGGGSPADSTELIHAIRRSSRNLTTFACVYDPAFVADAAAVGSGSRMAGARIGDRRNPVSGNFLVESLHDGVFTESEARHGGFTSFDQGPTAVVRVLPSAGVDPGTTREPAITLMVTSKRMPPFSLRQLTAFGVDPRAFDIIVAKGVIAPIAAYREVVTRIIHVNTAGVTCADMKRLDYTNRRRPMWPFEEI